MYPNRYALLTNFPREEQQGSGISTTAMQAEYSRIAESISQIVTALRQITTSDGKLKLDQAVRLLDVITAVNFGTGNGVTTVFAFPQPIDSSVDLVRAFVNGVRTDPISITDANITFAVAPAGGAAITGQVYMNLAGVIDRLQSVVDDEGASMIGIADAAGHYDADNVEDALAEIAADLFSLNSSIGNIDDYVKRDGSKTLTGQWEVNERSTTTIPPAAAFGSFRVNANPVDGDYLQLFDGETGAAFEFDNNASVLAGKVLVPIGATPAITAQSLVDLINASPLAINATLAGQDVSLIHEIPYAAGNQPIISVGAGLTAIVGMTGGVNGSFSSTYRTHYRLRNHPQSLRDGDVVVHEQLNNIMAAISSALAAFLRTDGGNQMVGTLNLGGQKAINGSDATTPTGLTTLQQIAPLITAEGNTKLSLIGTKDTPAEGTLTGPVTLGRVATDIADVNQYTTPATVAKNTIYGVPKPAANDHVANKLYVDELIAALALGGGSIYPSFDIEGDGLGGAGLTTLVPGGEYYFHDLSITAAQALTVPCKIFCSGTFTITNTGSITSTAPVEILALGVISIQGAISCPHLTIRGGSTLTVAAAISAHTAVGTYQKKYPFAAPSMKGYPIGIGATTGDNVLNAQTWRAVLIDVVGAISITAAVTADDIFIKCGGAVTITSTFTARWYMGTAWNTDATNQISWWDGYKNYSVGSAGNGPGGTGGTGGGGGVGGAGDSIFKPATRPYLFDTYSLARGGFGGRNNLNTPAGDGQRGRGGGRISIYADGNLTLTAAVFNVTGGYGDDIFGGGNDGGGGGAGSCRLITKGTMTDGTINAIGGGSNDGTTGGGGLAAMVAAGYAGVQSRTVTGAVAGTSVAVTLTAATIAGLKQRLLFEAIN